MPVGGQFDLPGQNATDNIAARMEEAIGQQAEITAISAEANVELAKLNAIKKAFEKIQG